MAVVPLSIARGPQGAGRVFGLGNVPIPGLGPEWSLGDPESELWGASYYNGSKVIGTVTNPASPSGLSWETEATLYAADWDQATQDAIQAAANADYDTYLRWKAIQTATPEMRAVLTDPEWISHQDSGEPMVWDQLSGELQDKIKAVPALYAQFTDPQQFATDVAAGQYAAPTTTSTEPARYLQNGLEVDASGNPVPGGYNALLDLIHQHEAAGVTPGVWSPDMIALVNQNPALYSALPADVQQTYARTGTSLQQQGSVSPQASIPAPVDFSSVNAPGPMSAPNVLPASGGVSFAPDAGAGAPGAPASGGGSSVPWALIGAGALGFLLLSSSRRRR